MRRPLSYDPTPEQYQHDVKLSREQEPAGPNNFIGTIGRVLAELMLMPREGERRADYWNRNPLTQGLPPGLLQPGSTGDVTLPIEQGIDERLVPQMRSGPKRRKP